MRPKVLFRDEADFEFHSVIEATDSAQPVRGTVQVGDDAAIRWRCAVGDPATGDAGLLLTDVVQVIAQALTGHNA